MGGGGGGGFAGVAQTGESRGSLIAAQQRLRARHVTRLSYGLMALALHRLIVIHCQRKSSLIRIVNAQYNQDCIYLNSSFSGISNQQYKTLVMNPPCQAITKLHAAP